MGAGDSRQQLFYIVACSDKPEGGIHLHAMRERDGRVGGVPEPVGFTALPESNCIVFSPDKRFMYATCVIDGQGAVAALAVDDAGRTTLLETRPTGGNAPCHLATDHAGRHLYVANYLGGNFAEFRLDHGRLGERTRVVDHVGGGPNLPRQDAPHPHFAGFTPDGRHLCVIDLGNDAVHVYPYDPALGIDPDGVVVERFVRPGAGPRHLVFDGAGRTAYLLNELGNTVVGCRYDAGRFTPVETVDTLPSLVNSPTKASAIRLSPDGRFLFASNRGFDSVAVFRLTGGGRMVPHDMVLSGGSSPRDVNFLPGGRMFACANEFSDRVCFFDYDPSTGKLSPNGLRFELPRPLYVLPFPT